ncbi:tyrosine-type recombinase/integrase [Rhizobium sp. BR 317]|uniref:tyrosine-type recombinase/integrase n=1 Tax=Rhizobium sp. BR 317 TaxID=3040015 RepID=UPI0039BF7208
MNTMKMSLEQYLALRRSLGFKLQSQESRLRNFVEYAQARGEQYITAKLAVEWAEHQCGPRTWSSRLSTVRSFARHLILTDPKTEIPPSGIFAPQRRPRPFIYSDDQIADPLKAMPLLHPGSFRGVTYHYFFGLLASTGMRFSEAARLLREDADMETGALTIRETKFGKSRYIPLHTSTWDALRRYCIERDLLPSRRASRFFFTGVHRRKSKAKPQPLSPLKAPRNCIIPRGSQAQSYCVHSRSPKVSILRQCRENQSW